MHLISLDAPRQSINLDTLKHVRLSSFSSVHKRRFQTLQVRVPISNSARNMLFRVIGKPVHTIGLCYRHSFTLICALMVIYVNDLPFALKNCEVTFYADDTGTSYSPRSVVELTDTLNCQSRCLKEWLQANKLSLNVIKRLRQWSPNLDQILKTSVNH